MLHLVSNMGVLNMLLLILAVLSALVLGFSAMRYIVFSNPKDEINFEDDDSIYAFYGGAKRERAGSVKRVTFEDM